MQPWHGLQNSNRSNRVVTRSVNSLIKHLAHIAIPLESSDTAPVKVGNVFSGKTSKNDEQGRPDILLTEEPLVRRR